MVLQLRLILNGHTAQGCTLRQSSRGIMGHRRSASVLGYEMRAWPACYRLTQELRSRERQLIKNPPIGGLSVIELSRVVINVDLKCSNTY